MAASLESFVNVLKAAAEPSRLRILSLLSRGDLTVTDLTEILNQSQPRVSRHLKLLAEEGLIERDQEGSWAFFRLSEREPLRQLALDLVGQVSSDDPQLERDGERLAAVKARRQTRAADYFARNAGVWDALRSLHAPDEAVEAALLRALGTKPLGAVLDLGTGTGRILELLKDRFSRGVGLDQSREMLAVARANLERAGVTHAKVRQGDLFALPVERNSFDLVTVHQVLHYLDEPGLALREAARALRAGGRLAVVDFAPHALEFLREEHAHRRLGFSDKQMADWFAESGLAFEDAHAVAVSGAPGALTVKIWTGRDERRLIAAPTVAHSERETA